MNMAGCLWLWKVWLNYRVSSNTSRIYNRSQVSSTSRISNTAGLWVLLV